ncbi:hypothetical protein B0T17DRAFT_620172 [Bombardia bombarda]|uniref:Uncharacterized protein n=1 Tax=Bombardia bombarda TaxID=252184 RepID=A0AA39TZN6_9PEZI|nr:hypothetical protein B0T17DRAFT_620172 [Bombardia bombarda]
MLEKRQDGGVKICTDGTVTPSEALTKDAVNEVAAPRDLSGDEMENLKKRSTNEGYYSLGAWSSAFVYYSNARSGSQNGELPTDHKELVYGSRVTWEGSKRCATFDTGVQFCSTINSGAQNLVTTGVYAGSGSNGYNSFNCYKDNGRALFMTGSGSFNQNERCEAIYYCYSNA